MLNTNIKIGSRIVFNKAPETIDTIEYFGLPSALITEFNVVPTIINGSPSAITNPYSNAYGLILSVQPNKFNNCGNNAIITIKNITEIIIDVIIPLATPLLASSFFFSPSFKLR